MERKQPSHSQQHTAHADQEKQPGRHGTQDESSGETSQRTENEIKARSESGFRQTHAHPFHQNFRGGSVRTHINSHMTHDAEK